MGDMSKLKAIIFDADGQLILSPEYFSDYYAREHGASKDLLDEFFVTIFPECTIGKKDLKEELGVLLPEIGSLHTPEEYLDMWFNFEKSLDGRVIAFIKDLKSRGVKCFLATNNEKYRMEFLRTELGFEELFDAIYSSGETGFKKPEPALFQLILDANGLDPKDVLFCDDTERNIAGAEEFGLETHHYQNLEAFQQEVLRRI